MKVKALYNASLATVVNTRIDVPTLLLSSSSSYSLLHLHTNANLISAASSVNGHGH